MVKSGAGGLRLSEAGFAWLLVLPVVIGIGLVVVVPLAYSLWLSFTDVNLLRTAGPALEAFGIRLPLYRWVGLKNYLQVFDDPLYWSSLWRTLYFVGAFVAEATLAGMQSIGEDQSAAAEVDVAGYWQRFSHVTRPALRPILFLVLVLCTVNGFLMLDLIYILTMGGPGYDTTTISWLGFQTTFKFFKFGPGTAILYTLTGLCLLMTLLYHRLILSGFEAEA